MAQAQISGFLVYHTDKYTPNELRWGFLPYDPRQFKDTDKVFVREDVVTIEVPDSFDPRSLQVEMLREKERMIRAEFAAKVKEIERQINSLLALENTAQAE